MRRMTYFMMALALVLGLTQCKKEPIEPQNEGNAVRITLDVMNEGDNDSRAEVNPPHVNFVEGDRILVAYDGKYVGYLEHNGSNFRGSINATGDDTKPLYFYFLGNCVNVASLNPGSTTSCKAIISDQTGYPAMPVISFSASNEDYKGAGSYTARLHNKASLMKFNVTTPSNSPICITGMNNKVMVDFSKAANDGENNGFTYGMEGAGAIELKGGSGNNVEKWAIVLPTEEAIPAGDEGSVFTNDGYKGSRPSITNPIAANQYLDDGISMTVNTFDKKYVALTLEALTNGTIVVSGQSGLGMKYSLNGGAKKTMPSVIEVTTGDKVAFYGKFYNTGTRIAGGTAQVKVYGNIMSLINETDYATLTTLPDKWGVLYNLFRENTTLTDASGLLLPATALTSNSCYSYMFYGCTNLTAAPELLPASTLTPSCYSHMFYGCTNLTTAPELPASTLADYCYYGMFRGCTSLTAAPELPASIVANNCCLGMFYGCTSLTTAPSQLPATELADDCYFDMFYGCTSLTAAPELLATTLAQYCYSDMFYGCTSLVTAPSQLPVTELADACYAGMFSGCSSLNMAPALPATTLTESCYAGMFSDCTSLTTAPELPAETLAGYCYDGMFTNCINLTAAPALPATTLTTQCYERMFFGCTSLNTAPALPATTLANRCYDSMFSGCTSLNTAPTLSATTLAEKCYSEMFKECTSLTTAPERLPATTLTTGCYYGMFNGCTSLTTAPALPATSLADYCYYAMFYGCTSLTTAPEVLPATTLAQYCYLDMFDGCTSLTTAPALPATTLVNGCYGNMFRRCTSLSSITCLATEFGSDNKNDWVYGVAPTGTFTKASDATWPTGNSGIPSGWTVMDAAQ